MNVAFDLLLLPETEPMAFEKFTEKARSFRPKLSVRSNSTIGLNAPAVTKFKLKDVKCVVLFYDRDEKRIGMQPTINPEEDGAHPLNLSKTGAWVSARRFLDYFGLSTAETKRYDAGWDDHDKMIVAKLM
jgi:hypothetical protein